MPEIFSVSQITRNIKQTIEESFEDVSVEGEISNFKKHFSGHWYFTLKDSDAQINCTMWKGINNYVFFSPADGMKVIVQGRVTVYAPRGTYQIEVRSMKPAGVGELQAQFDRLKQKLASEGLFDAQHKKSIPEFPERIGIVTALDGAALRDMISVSRRRYPLVELVICPSKVQGEGAAENIVESLNMLNQLEDIDLIIAGRGGGSLEDLWAFNEEIVARAIYASRIPVISAVGHEIDFTIADFVADQRAATPTAAMEMATPSKQELSAYLNENICLLTDKIHNLLSEKKRAVTNLTNSYGFRIPRDMVRNKCQYLDNLIYRIDQEMLNRINQEKNRLELLTHKLEANNVRKILEKGFVIVMQNGHVVRRAESFDRKNSAVMKFFDGDILLEGVNEKEE